MPNRTFYFLLLLTLFCACGDDSTPICPEGFVAEGDLCVQAPDTGVDSGVDGSAEDAHMDADAEDAAADAPPADALPDMPGDTGSDVGEDAPMERCSGEDDDGDGRTDEGFPTTSYYLDRDGDDFGSGDPCDACDVALCGVGDWVTADGDCDETCASCFPDNPEVCDMRNNDCDGETDEGVTTTYFPDADDDNFGDSRNPQEACSPPSGFVTIGGDCADGDERAFPGQPTHQTTPIIGARTSGTGPFDFDCSGSESREFSFAPSPCPNSACRDSHSTSGAECGDSVEFSRCNSAAGNCFLISTTTRTLGCR